jgi:hypothetical protein
MYKWQNIRKNESTIFGENSIAIGINTRKAITQPLDDKIWASIIDTSGHILIWDSMTGVFHGSI